MYSKIILPLDGSAHAECALPHAAALAKGLGVKLILLQVIPYPEVRDAGVEAEWATRDRQYMDGIAVDLKKSGVKDVQVEVLWGEVQKEIVDYAQADEDALIVMSTHGRTGLAKLAFGSVTEAVLRQATAVPVTVCHCFSAAVAK
jgi:nucleotide-binding universal stress UspA family protein